ncbi:Response regulator PleD [Rubripirellula amarantea]|uniref:diguanylate cyclase n=1 Tax=Rubripirellula amarantea TaxID=2527999 RepID=A0A5C5WUR9_9BACT|nr:GGDEF domain-containing response regulator [Rubripirellula amarantea]TWT54704.1 Response regulator PleD [Rubripirellula amarantea]
MNLHPLDTNVFDVKQLVADAVNRVAPVAEILEPSKPRAVSSIRLLLIEDDELDAAILLRTLRKQTLISFTVDRVASMHEAITKLQVNDYDVALADINLPDAMGADSFEQLTAFDSCLPIIVLTGHEDDDLALRAVQSGAQDFISKSNLSTQGIVRTIRFAIVRQQMSLGYQAAAQTDSLTGMPNRRTLDCEFSGAAKVAKHLGTPLCVAMIDIDHFKNVNEQFGHCIGDAVLCQVATLLMRHIHGDTWACRFGGEEFALLMPQYDIVEAQNFVEEFLNRLQSQQIMVGNQRLEITASAGLSCVSCDESRAVAFARCSQALRVAKSNGRNRIELFTESDSPKVS